MNLQILSWKKIHQLLPLLILLVVSFGGLLSNLASATEPVVNHGYPLNKVQLNAGLVLCTSEAQVNQTFANRKRALETGTADLLANGCTKSLKGDVALITYVGPLDSDHFTGDLLKFAVFRSSTEALEVKLFIGYYYGHGEAKLKEGLDLEKLAARQV